MVSNFFELFHFFFQVAHAFINHLKGEPLSYRSFWEIVLGVAKLKVGGVGGVGRIR
jgi:hypothetical protein